VLLSNQRCQNEKMSINEFDEFLFPVSPLDDDSFASLSATYIMTIGSIDTDAKVGSGSEYEAEEEDEGDDEDYDE
jgi:hypothetical protein